MALGLVVATVAVLATLSAGRLHLDPTRPSTISYELPDPGNRREAFDTGLDTLADHPLTGKGPGTYVSLNRGQPFRAHFTPLNVAATMGLPALAALTFLVVVLWRERRRPTSIATWSGLLGAGGRRPRAGHRALPARVGDARPGGRRAEGLGLFLQLSEEQKAACRADRERGLLAGGGGRGRRRQRAHRLPLAQALRAEGEAGLLDRSSAPRSIPHRTPAERVAAIEALRRLHMTAAEIAEVLWMALSTVSAVLKRIARQALAARTARAAKPLRAQAPGELVHLDIKKLGRISALGAGHRVTGNRASRTR